MIEQLADSLASLSPLTIREASYTENISLVLAGEGWAFSTVSAWRVIRGGVLAYGWSDARAADLVWDLCWQQIVSVTAQSQAMRGDPVFGLSTGERLEIFSDHPINPWVFRLPEITYVGSPSDPGIPSDSQSGYSNTSLDRACTQVTLTPHPGQRSAKLALGAFGWQIGWPP